MRYKQTLTVGFEYDVIFTSGVFAPDNSSLADALGSDSAKAVFYLDEGLAGVRPETRREIEDWCAAHSGNVSLAAPVQVVPGGEYIKSNISILDSFGRLALECGLDRHSYVVIVGGGAVLDAVGFAAATVHRGLRQIRIPTTVLSQNDSSVGVKNGLNRFSVKNYYGAFAPPSAVIIDTDFLDSLPERDWKAGISEAFKVGIIKDGVFLDSLIDDAPRLAARDCEAMKRLVIRSAEIHMEHIVSSGDAFERQSSRPLDFGHWTAHRLEDVTGYDLRHGEAVGIGLCVDLYCAVKLGLIRKEDMERIISALGTVGLPVYHKALSRRNEDGVLDIVEGLEQFRQHLGGALELAMPDGLGRMRFINELPPLIIEEAVRYLEEYSR